MSVQYCENETKRRRAKEKESFGFLRRTIRVWTPNQNLAWIGKANECQGWDSGHSVRKLGNDVASFYI